MRWSKNQAIRRPEGFSGVQARCLLPIAGRPAPTGETKADAACRSLPASESCRATGITSRDKSPAGWLLQGKEKPMRLVFVGDKPASESRRATGITSGKHSPAGWLLQGQSHGLVFAGAGLKRSERHHLKIFFARAALRAGPVHGHIGPQRAGCNAVLGSASGFVIDPAADQAHPGGRVGGGGHGERAPLIRWVRLYRCGFAFPAGTI